MNKILSIILIMLSATFLSSCGSTNTNDTASTDSVAWIDVRTIEEYSNDHIEGDINIPIGSIDIATLVTMYAKDDEINLYCRSGNRAGKAKTLLEEAGFTNVNNVGGINDVRTLRNIATQNPGQ